jgi:hypothetical protein
MTVTTMEFLGGLWGKLNKPIHFLMVGAAILTFSPTEVRWMGYLFIAFGLAGLLEWLGKYLIRLKEEYQKRHTITKSLSYLNAGEKRIIKKQISAKEQTFYLNWNDYHNMYANSDAPDKYRKLVGIIKGLSDKGIIAITVDDTVASCHFLDPAWKVLLKRYS